MVENATTASPRHGAAVSRAPTGRVRAAAALVALVAWSGLLAGCVAVFGRTGSVGATAWIMSAYFTNTTALLVAVLFTGLALGAPFRGRPSFLAGAALMVLLVGIVQRLLLHGLRTLHGADALADVLLHIVLPVLVPAFWLAFADKGRLRLRDPLLWAAYPLAYLGYALARGASGGHYVYPFIDLPQIGGIMVLAHVAAITAGFLASGAMIVLLDSRIGSEGPRLDD